MPFDVVGIPGRARAMQTRSSLIPLQSPSRLRRLTRRRLSPVGQQLDDVPANLTSDNVMGRSSTHHSKPSSKRKAQKAKQGKGKKRPDAQISPSAADRAQQIAQTTDDNTFRFMRTWMGYNALYDAPRNDHFSSSERSRLMICIEQGMTDVQASEILESLDEAIHYYARFPPGNMRLNRSNSEFRRRASEDMQIVLDAGEHPTKRLAHLMAAVYQVRCNLFHGQKIPQNDRSQKLFAMGNEIVQRVVAVLIENSKK